ncbi:MAG: sulfite exporter TauE/SafE family protein [Bacteroidota bacterium]
MHINIEPKKPIPIIAKKNSFENIWYLVPIVILGLVIAYLFFSGKVAFSVDSIIAGINREFFIFLGIGIAAQLVDGTLGMGYGATSTSFLLTMGIPPAISSSSVHLSEMFTTGASAISHHRFGNINNKLFKYLLLPGIIGSVIGAYLLSDVLDGDAIKPFIALYMIILGSVIIRKALKTNIVKKKTKRLGALATFGGFMDAVGGGGWGPIVTSTLLGRGRDPRYTIGSVNAAEFAVAFSSGITFLFFQGFDSWQVASGLILGGVIAAPFGAFLLGKLPRKPLMIMVGILVIVLSMRTLYKIYF